MDKFLARIENATQEVENRTFSPSDYMTTEQYTVNITDGSDKDMNWAMLGVLPIVAFVAVGNILVILAVKLDHKLRSSTNYFLTSLAVADLLVALTVMPPSLVMIINNYTWPFPESLCGFWIMLDVCFSTSSILHLCTISLDRYWALAKPFHYRNSGWTWSTGRRGTNKGKKSKWRSRSSGLANSAKLTKRVTKRILLVWGVSLGIALPLPIMGHQNRDNIFIDHPGGGSMCVINVPEFTIYASLVAFFLPLVVMLVTYSLTIRTLQKQSKLVRIIMGKEGSGSHWGRPSRSSSITSGLSYNRRTSMNGPSMKHGKRISSGSYDAMPALPDIVCTSTELKPIADCNANTSKSKTLPLDKRFNRILPRSISDITPLKDDREKEHGSNEAENKHNTLQKSGSDASDMSSVSNHQSVLKRSPMLARANMKLSKVVSKLPLNRVSTRRISASIRSRVIATEQRASKVLGMIFTLFCLFWCPFFITNAFSGMCICYNLHCNLELMGNLMNWFVWVGYVSSGVNPCVYTLFSRQFRNTFKKLLCCRWNEISEDDHHGGQGFYAENGCSSTSSFRRDYSYKRHENGKLTLENGNTNHHSRTDREEFTTSQFKSNQQAHNFDVYSTLDRDNVQSHQHRKRSQQFQWRSKWNSNLNDNGFTGMNHQRNGSKVTFGSTSLQPEVTEKPLLLSLDTSSDEKMAFIGVEKELRAIDSDTL